MECEHAKRHYDRGPQNNVETNTKAPRSEAVADRLARWPRRYRGPLVRSGIGLAIGAFAVVLSRVGLKPDGAITVDAGALVLAQWATMKDDRTTDTETPLVQQLRESLDQANRARDQYHELAMAHFASEWHKLDGQAVSYGKTPTLPPTP
jgi:hypothetical protein